MKGLLIAAMLAAGTPAGVELTAPGPNGPLAGTLIEAGKAAPVVVILPGSGPTDRDGNNPMGVTAAPYRLLAEALAARGVSTVRVDKRGLFGSARAIADPNAVTIAAYAADAHAWAKVARARTGAVCVWLLGHSEGGLVALAAAGDGRDQCGVILVATPGRPLGQVMRDQLRANPANAPILAPALGAIDSLEAGKRVDVATLPPALRPLFSPAVQGFEIDLFSYDPAKLAAAVTLPILVVQGDRDLQVTVGDATALSAAQRGSRVVVVSGMNHVLKLVGDDRAANMASYADQSRPVAPALVDAVVRFVKK